MPRYLLHGDRVTGSRLPVGATVYGRRYRRGAFRVVTEEGQMSYHTIQWARDNCRPLDEEALDVLYAVL